MDGVDTITIDFTEKTQGKVGLLAGKHAEHVTCVQYSMKPGG